jgi:hypothetical protein
LCMFRSMLIATLALLVNAISSEEDDNTNQPLGCFPSVAYS